jgi:outer membrane lipoprotein-sorting protein
MELSELVGLLYHAPSDPVSGDVTETTGGYLGRRRYRIHVGKPGSDRLLRPRWLLTGYTLSVGENLSVDGRDGVAITAQPRAGLAFAAAHPKWPGLRSGSVSVARREMGRDLPERITAVVDAELGVLLRCAEFRDDRQVRSWELSVTETGADADTESPEEDDDTFGFSENLAGQALKSAWRLGADAFGSWVTGKISEPDPDADVEEMPPLPPDWPVDDNGPTISDALLVLLQESGAREFSATVHEWIDPRALGWWLYKAADVSGAGGLGSLGGALEERGPTHKVSSLRYAGPSRYRVDYVSGHDAEPATIVCDGENLWQFETDEVTVSPAKALPDDFADVTDSAWLLKRELSAESETELGGRRAIRFLARLGSRSEKKPPVMTDVTIDAELGIPLRIITYAPGGPPLQCIELREVTDSAGDLDPDVPPGVRVTHESGDLLVDLGVPEPIQAALRTAADAARHFFGQGFGGR